MNRSPRGLRIGGSAAALLFFLCLSHAQGEEFFYNLPLPKTEERGVFSASLGFGSRAQRIQGFEGWEERFSLRYPLGDALVLLGETGMATGDQLRFAPQAGVGVAFPHLPLPLGFTLSALKEYGGVFALEARLVSGIRRGASEFVVNLVSEKAFAPGRDPVDLHLRAGYAYQLSPLLSLGGEYVGDDLEALWEPEEAEGGTRHFLSPRVSFSLGKSLSLAMEPGLEIHLPEPGDPRGGSPRFGVLFRTGLSQNF